MTVPNFPLGKPLRDDFSYQFGEGRRRTRNDTGPVSTRLRTSASVDTAQASFLWDANAVAQFEKFYDGMTLKGVLPFWMLDPHRDDQVLTDGNGVPILTISGVQLIRVARILCVFGEGLPSVAPLPQSHLWRVRFNLDIMP